MSRVTPYDTAANGAAGEGACRLKRRLDIMSVLVLCSDTVLPERADASGTYTMGIDTGRQLHTVVLRGDDQDRTRRHLVHLGAYPEFSDLDALMARYGARGLGVREGEWTGQGARATVKGACASRCASV